jgi:hypothetical protein
VPPQRRGRVHIAPTNDLDELYGCRITKPFQFGLFALQSSTHRTILFATVGRPPALGRPRSLGGVELIVGAGGECLETISASLSELLPGLLMPRSRSIRYVDDVDDISAPTFRGETT